MCKIASKLSMNLELYKNLGNCLSEAEILVYDNFSFAFFQSPRSRRVAGALAAPKD
jgi:hypothetical protein